VSRKSSKRRVAERAAAAPGATEASSEATSLPDRVMTDGKFFRLGARKFYPKGVTYGPFEPDAGGSTFGTPAQVESDFDLLRLLNANCVRVYYVPPDWFLDLAHRKGIRVLVEYPWPKHTCFLDDRRVRNEARRATRETAERIKGHPAVLAMTLVNEIPADIARWYGPEKVDRFIDDLAEVVKEVDPQRLVTFANYPPTEFLQPANIDFVSFNVYLHHEQPFVNYLDRLQSLAGEKPLVITEFGIDSMREGEDRKCEILASHIAAAFRGGAAGMILFSFTDEWFTGGFAIDNWYFGLTDRARSPKKSFHTVAGQFGTAPYFPLPAYPKVSVVVASYNGGRTLPACLDSLTHLNYPNAEIILVDDGSTDDTQRIVSHYPQVRNIRQANEGLSAARNAGIAASTGEIVAFTDSDCRADEDWLHYLVNDLLRSGASAIGGHNFTPHDGNWVASCVAVSPGNPAHVMLDDRRAEHIPGCNMAFWKWALGEIEGFDRQFRAAGDDVDVCWRLLQRGRQIAFSHAGFVWHYRRNSVAAYLKQQRGYGVAEMLLRGKHPEFFNNIGAMRWRGKIYGAGRTHRVFGQFVVYHGVFGGALFQTLYTPEPTGLLMLATSLEWHVLATLGSTLLALIWPTLWPLPVLSALLSLSVAGAAAAMVILLPRNKRIWSRALIALLHLLQPVIRGWPRYAQRLTSTEPPPKARSTVRDMAGRYRRVPSVFTCAYWTEAGVERVAFLEHFLKILDRDRWTSLTDSGWDEFDVVIFGDRFSRVLVKTVCENHGGSKRLMRARLSAHWTLLAKIYVGAIGFVAALFYAFSEGYAGSIAPALLVPLFVMYLHHRTRRSMTLARALLDLAAQETGFAAVRPAAAARAPEGETSAATAPAA
jgi:O-antigen biosynthesis protein